MHGCPQMHGCPCPADNRLPPPYQSMHINSTIDSFINALVNQMTNATITSTDEIPSKKSPAPK